MLAAILWVLIPGLIFGLFRALFMKKGWVPPEQEGTPYEQMKFNERMKFLTIMHTVGWWILLMFWLQWFAPGLWDQYFVVYAVFGLCVAFMVGLLTGNLHNRKLEEGKYRIKKTTPKKGFWRQLWDEDRNPKIS
jgi:hypothetical protein